MASKKENVGVNFVHQNAILCETIKKEQQNQKLYTSYSVNPFTKMYTLTGKPNSLHDSADGEEDDTFLKVITRAHRTPVEKFEFPQTSNQDYGWNTQPLIEDQRTDPRLHHPRQNSEVTKYMDVAWRVKEQSENMN